jgi:glutathione S-transferase
MLHWAATLGAGRRRTVPVLVTDEGVFADSTDILRWVDRRADTAGALRPADARLRAECDALEDHFDEQLGPHIRRVGYHYVFADSALILELARRAAPSWQFETMRATLPLARLVMLRGMRINEATVAHSRDEVRRHVDAVAARLADGRRYLVGDRFSAADLTFAALAAPMVLPDEHPFPLPFERLPEPMQALCREMQAHPAGAFVLRLYAEHRRPPVG